MKAYSLGLFFISLLFVQSVVLAQDLQSDNDFSEFDLDEPEIKIDNPELDEPTILKHAAPDQPQQQTNNKEENEQKNEFQDLASEDDEEEVTVEEEIEPKEDLPGKEKEQKPFEPMKLSSLPLHLRNNWASYYIEIGLVVGILLYFINFFVGSSANQRLADNFWNSNLELLQSHFSLVGDDGTQELEKATYVKDSDNLYILWATGRFGYECCIIELHLNKRQDLLSTLWSFIKPSADQVVVKIFLKDDAMDSFVFCLANKKTGLKSVKEYNDVVSFCTQRKSVDKYTFLNDNFILLNEIGDVTSLVLDNQLVNLLAKSPELINFIHISDQFSGPKPGEDVQQTKAPPTKKVLTLSFNCPKNLSSVEVMEEMKEFVSMSLNLAERVKRYKLKKDMKQKAVQNRKKIEEYYEKLASAEKREAAQLKKEERRRLEKEKIIDANDELKLRKFEEKEYKKEMKKKLKPKIKQVIILYS